MPFKPIHPLPAPPELPSDCLAFEDLRAGMGVRVVAVIGLPPADVAASELVGTSGLVHELAGALWYEARARDSTTSCDRAFRPCACLSRRLLRHVRLQRADP